MPADAPNFTRGAGCRAWRQDAKKVGFGTPSSVLVLASVRLTKLPWTSIQGRGRYSFRCFRSACFGLFLAGFGLFWAIFAHWGGLGAHLDARRGALLTALADVPN